MVSQAFRDVAYPQETGEAIILLVKIEHDALPSPIFLTDMRWDHPSVTTNAEGAYVLTVAGDDHVCAPIAVIPPGQSDEEPQGKIQVPNVDQRIGEALDAIAGPATITVTAVLESDPEEIVGGPHSGLKLQNVKIDAMLAEGDLLRPQISTAAWPKQWIRPAKFKAAFRR
jgi:hypothetical protein